MSIPVIFDWEVPKKGFSITDGFSAEFVNDDIETSPCSVLVPNGIETKTTQPLDHGGLFRTFAATEPTTEGILAFVKKHGPLGIQKISAYFNKENALRQTYEDDWEKLGAVGENIDNWIREIRWMRNVLNLYDHIEEMAPEYIRWEGYREVWLDLPGGSKLIASGEKNPELLLELRPGDAIGPATTWILYCINYQIKDSVPQMSIINGCLQTYISPSSLLAALWLQFSIAIAEEKKYQACKHCGTYFEIGTGRGQRTKKFCSESCRVMAHRKKNQ